jgi:ribose transport system permease protein
MTVSAILTPFRRYTYAFSAFLAALLLIGDLAGGSTLLQSRFLPGTLAAFAPLALAAMASTPAILSGGGGLDISIGPLMTLVNVLFGLVLLRHGLGAAYVAIPLLVGFGAFVGAVNGTVVSMFRFQPVIATLCMYFILGGVSLQILPQPLALGHNWTTSLGGSIGPIPGALFTIGAPLAFWGLLGRTSFLKSLYAVGGNDASAYSAGVNISLVRVLAYALGGAFAAVAGIALTALLQSSDSSTSSEFLLIAIASVALGGTPLVGGRGSMVGALTGAACIFLIENLLDTLNVSGLWLDVFYGGALIVAVVIGSRLTVDRRTRAIA